MYSPAGHTNTNTNTTNTKLFVGNLSFKTREADLASEFSSAGKVVSANIITRGSRSMGYGFVEFETEEDALKAIPLMNKKTIDSRDINVEIATARDENNAPESRSQRRRFRGGDRPAGPGRVQRYRPRNPEDAEGPSTRGSFPRRGRGGYRGTHQRPDLSDRTPSQTTLFVANLPFSLDDAGFEALFKDLRYKKAHVVVNRVGRSKGFGFVEFENEEDQLAAKAVAETLEVQGRVLTVKIALTENPRQNYLDHTSSSQSQANEREDYQ